MIFFKLIQRTKYILYITGLFIAQQSAFGQFYSTGQEQWGIKWRQINTQNFNIVYSSEFEAEANRLANILEYSREISGNSLNKKPKKISVLVHNQSIISNGMVAWAPKRMELYPVSPQDCYPQEWMQQLSIHELRHVAQMDKLNQNTTKWLGFFYGQQIVGAMSGLVQPWLLEGDAVVTETALTQSGRGRIASFEMELKAQVIEKNKTYSLQKALLGSYKDYTPDHYQVGYQIVAYNRCKYGEKFWENSINYIATKPFVIFPLAKSIKKQTGKSKNTIYKETFQYLDSVWTSEKKQPSDYTTITKANKKNYTNYRYPQLLNDSTVIALKSGIDIKACIIQVNTNTGKEKKILTTGILPNESLSVANNIMVWAEYIPDARWQNRNYSVIRLYDFVNKKTLAIGHKTRYFAPALSTDATLLAAVECDLKNQYSLIIIDIEDKEIVKQFTTPNNQAIQRPQWDKKNETIVVTTVSDKGKSILSLNIKTGIWETLVHPEFSNISSPILSDNTLYFTSDKSGTDEIYAKPLSSDSLFKVTTSNFGSFDPVISPNNKKIIYSQYTSYGYQLVKANITSSTWEIAADNIKKHEIADSLSRQETSLFIPENINYEKYETKPYNKASHLINVHSWAPYCFDYNNIDAGYVEVKPGISMMSQNLLGTLLTNAGIELNNGYNIFHLNFSYRALYPIIYLQTDYGNDIPLKSKTYKLRGSTLGTYIPINLTRRNIITGFIPRFELQYTPEQYIDSATTSKSYKSYNTSIRFLSYKIPSYRDIIPRLGVIIEGYYYTTPDFSSKFRDLSCIQSTIYLPGPIKHHSFKLSAGLQNESWFFNSPTNLPRGYINNIQNEWITKNNAYTIDYVFPILYPDITIKEVMFIKRLRGSLFFDYAELTVIRKTDETYNKYYKNIRTAGFELVNDINFFYFNAPISIGYRASRLIDNNKWDHSVVLYVQLNSF